VALINLQSTTMLRTRFNSP